MPFLMKWNYMRGFYYTRLEKAERKRIDVPYLDIEIGSESKLYKGDNVRLKLDELGENGWELFSTTPVIGQKPVGSAAAVAGLFSVDPGSGSGSSTLGVMLWFKKQID